MEKKGRFIKLKLLNITIFGMLILVSSLINLACAGLITDTENDSFIDETTGIEWMDFGINNHLKHGDVVAQLNVGGEYYGWALPSEEQVRTMWINAFSNLGADTYEEDANGTEFRYKDGAFEQGSVFTELLNTMSFNGLRDAGAVNERMYSYGRYIGARGMSRVTMYSYTDRLSNLNGYDMVEFDNSPTSDYTKVRASNSTLLIKVTSGIKVSEPSTLIIFALALIGIASLRLKIKYKC